MQYEIQKFVKQQGKKQYDLSDRSRSDMVSGAQVNIHKMVSVIDIERVS